jgi:hypothetical protein
MPVDERLDEEQFVSEDKDKEAPVSNAKDDAPEERQESTRNGPTFTESPDPMAGIRKAAGDAWKSTEGKSVSMRVYIGTIAGIVILMLLARCGS